jgi:hypothetical protein
LTRNNKVSRFYLSFEVIAIQLLCRRKGKRKIYYKNHHLAIYPKDKKEGEVGIM